MKKVNHGLVNSEVIVGLPNELEIVSIITKAAVENLNLKEGKEVYAINKCDRCDFGYGLLRLRLSMEEFYCVFRLGVSFTYFFVAWRKGWKYGRGDNYPD